MHWAFVCAVLWTLFVLSAAQVGGPLKRQSCSLHPFSVCGCLGERQNDTLDRSSGLHRTRTIYTHLKAIQSLEIELVLVWVSLPVCENMNVKRHHTFNLEPSSSAVKVMKVPNHMVVKQFKTF